MKSIKRLFPVVVLVAPCVANSVVPGNGPQLPITGTRIVNVSTEAQLQSAIGKLQNGDTIILSNGIYNLTSTLYINGRHNVTIRGTAGSPNVFLAGKGMDNSKTCTIPTARPTIGTPPCCSGGSPPTLPPSRTRSSTWIALWHTDWITQHPTATMRAALSATISFISCPAC